MRSGRCEKQLASLACNSEPRETDAAVVTRIAPLDFAAAPAGCSEPKPPTLGRRRLWSPERRLKMANLRLRDKALDEQRRGKRRSRTSSEALLLGRIFDNRGHRMTPSYAVKNGARYRYYVSCVLAQGRKHDAGSVPRVPAPEIEGIVLKALRDANDTPDQSLSERELVHERLAKVVVRTGRLGISLTLSDDAEPKRLDLPWSAPASRRKREIVGPPAEGSERRPMRAEARARLLAAIAKARRWLDGLIAGRFMSTGQIARQGSRRGPPTLRIDRFQLLGAAYPVGGTAAPRKLMLLLLGVRTRGRRFDSDLVHQAVSANRAFRVIARNSSRTPGLKEAIRDGLRSLCARVCPSGRGILQSRIRLFPAGPHWPWTASQMRRSVPSWLQRRYLVSKVLALMP
jgi:hypothetical protein